MREICGTKSDSSPRTHGLAEEDTNQPLKAHNFAVAKEIHTVGHSTHPIDRLIGLLSVNGITALADVRRHPGSRRNPQFNAAALSAALEAAGIAYEAAGGRLGGRRTPHGGSANAAWEVEAFRGYADHMQGAEFEEGVRRLEELSGQRRVAVMCAEADWRRCHRRLIADAMTAAGWRVLHIAADGRVEVHALTPFAVVEEGRVAYPPAQGSLTP